MKAVKAVIIFSICVVLVGCTQATPSTNMVQTAIAETKQSESISVAPTNEVAPTSTQKATATQGPTNTPKPTATQRPTATSTPAPEPIILSGSGDDVVELDKWSAPAILHIIGTGSGNFAVWNYGANNERIDLLVNTIGKYDGKKLIDAFEDESTKVFEINSNGSWTIEVYPITSEYMTVANFPGTYTGQGDDVVWFQKMSGIAKFDYPGGGNFAVWAFTEDGRDLLVNEIGPYSGKVLIQNNTYLIVVVAESTWSVTVID